MGNKKYNICKNANKTSGKVKHTFKKKCLLLLKIIKKVINWKITNNKHLGKHGYKGIKRRCKHSHFLYVYTVEIIYNKYI